MPLRVGATALLLVLVCVPRFNMWDPGPVRGVTAAARATPWGHPIDVEGYARLVRYVRGEVPASELMAPFCYRPIGPALAAAVPAAPVTAINLVNVASLVGVVWLLDAIGGLAGLRSRARWAAGLLFVCSFPTFYYGTIGFIDPVAIVTATLILYLVLRGAATSVLVPAVVLAVLAKETNLVFALLPLGALITGRRSAPAAVASAVTLCAAGAATYLLIRAVVPAPDQAFLAAPSLAAALENLSRPRTYLSLLLTVAIPAGLAIMALRAGKAQLVISRDHLAVLATGAVLALGLYVYSLLSAHADGRVIWIACPFVIPIAAAWWSTRGAFAAFSGAA